MTREEQIIEAAEKATYQKPPQYSELVHKTRKVMCAYEVGFIDGCVWADSHPHWISVEDELPKKKGAYLFHFNDGQTRVEGYFPDLHLSKCVTHWMPLPEAPRKEEHDRQVP